MKAGETLALLGPNGSGKTTLFRILTTAVAPQSGRVAVCGFDVSRSREEVRRRIGVVFQAPSLDKKLTVVENLKHHARLYGLARGVFRERSRRLLEEFGLADRQHERVEKLSGGLARRCELAKGLLHEPEVLILDEPSTGLDPGARLDLWRHLRQLARQGVTVLLTTHLMDEAERCDRVGIMDQGALVALGTPSALRAEIGGEVITVTTSQPEVVLERLRGAFPWPAQSIGTAVRLEVERGVEALAALAPVVGELADSLSLARPTLEDVFIRRTGHRFWSDNDHGG